MTDADITGYRYAGAEFSHAHAYLLPTLEAQVTRFFAESQAPRRLFDLGCGNGAVANYFQERGYNVSGVDPSGDGITMSRLHYPHLDLQIGSAYDNLQERFGRFPVVYSLEVVEHVYNPRLFASTLCSLVEPGGRAIVSTPYHGLLKNLAIIAAGKFDHHFDPLWDHGHIKFWSRNKLRILMEEAGFSAIEMIRIGRVAPLAKSVMAIGQRA